jgi:hypothetical protein
MASTVIAQLRKVVIFLSASAVLAGMVFTAYKVGRHHGFNEGMTLNSSLWESRDAKCMAWWFNEDRNIGKALNRVCKQHCKCKKEGKL